MMEYVNVNGADMSLRFDCSIGHDAVRDVEAAIRSFLGALDEKQIKQAIRNARSRSIKAGKALGAKLARQTYTARASAIKNRFIAKTYNDGASAGFRFNGFPGLNMIHFLARPNTDRAPRPKQGVSVKIKRVGSREIPKGKQANSSKPFVAKIKKSGPEMGIFVRYGSGEQRHMLYGPSPIQALLAPEKQEQIRARIEEIFERRLLHELDARLNGVIR